MDAHTTTTARRAAMWGRMIALLIAFPIYVSLLATLPALAAVLVVGLYLGIPHAVRRAIMDPAPQTPSVQ